MELTFAQRKALDSIRREGNTNGIDKRVINNLIKKGHLLEGGKLPEEPTPKKKAKTKKQKKKSRMCLCGCGEMTCGGKFRIGHDGKLRKKVLHQVRDGDKNYDLSTNEELAEYLKNAHWMTPEIWEALNVR